MAQIDKNTVSARNQLKDSNIISFENLMGEGKRILFVGNSITRHGPLESIGWVNDWGMAASSKEKDYVHLTKKSIMEKDPDASFCICQVSEWECNYLNGEEKLSKYQDARDFDADIIVFRLIENCPHKDFDEKVFKEEFLKLIDMLDKSGEAKKIIASGFWKHPGDKTMEEIAKEIGADFIYLGDLGEDAKYRADGLFWHEGVAAHPGDKGMEEIARLIFKKVEKYL